MADNTPMLDEQKVAVLLATMHEKVAASVLQQLDPETMSRVAEAIRRLGVVPGEVRDDAINDCVRGIVQMSDSVQGNDKTANSLLTRAIGEKRANALLQEHHPVKHVAFESLQSAPEDQILNLLNNEQPGVIAIVLKNLSAEKAAKVMSLLPSDVRKRVIVLMCTADEPEPEVIGEIDAYFQSKIGPPPEEKKKGQEPDKLDAVTNILLSIDKSIEEELLSAVDEKLETLGSELRDRLFTFEDVVNLSDVAMRKILQEIDMGVLGMALRGASIDVREKFFNNMSKRAAEGLKEEMEYSQKIKRSEVEEKQKEIVNIIRSLESDGQITIGEGGSDEYV
ncbi:hypothetical protein BVX97_01515 [bacterium E08(2017)]|nr:hypothetical protein BVX97_01515 [bacterium E08(2017)]